jgi:hypothetical protein
MNRILLYSCVSLLAYVIKVQLDLTHTQYCALIVISVWLLILIFNKINKYEKNEL